jgi:hypothetical protein
MEETIFDNIEQMEDIIKNLFADKYSKKAKIGALAFFEHRNLGELFEKYGYTNYYHKDKNNNYDIYKFALVKKLGLEFKLT